MASAFAGDDILNRFDFATLKHGPLSRMAWDLRIRSAMRRIFLHSVLMVSSAHLLAQTAHRNEIRPYVGGGINFQVPDLVEYTTPKGTAIPWVGAGIEAGLSLTHMDRWGIALGGGLTEHGYMHYLDTACWTLHHQAQRAEVRAWRLFPFAPLEGAQARAGVAAGMSFQGDSDRRKNEEGFESRMVGPELTRIYLAPELGITREVGDHRLDLSLRYLYHLDRTPAWTSYSTSPVGNGTYTGTDDNLSLVFRYHFAIPRPAIERPPMPAIDFRHRAHDTLTTLSTNRSRVVIELWDEAEHDGDTISVLVNDVPVLVEHELTPQHFRLPVDLEYGTNRILVVAHNEGRVPPNTARAFIHTGKKRVQLLIKTGEKRNSAVFIHRD